MIVRLGIRSVDIISTRLGSCWAAILPKLTATPASAILRPNCGQILVAFQSKYITASFRLVEHNSNEEKKS